jgi:hypothetical protein
VRHRSTSKPAAGLATQSQSRKRESQIAASESGKASGSGASGAKLDKEKPKIGPPKQAAKLAPAPETQIVVQKEAEVRKPTAKSRSRSVAEIDEDEPDMVEITPKAKRTVSLLKRKIEASDDDDEENQLSESAQSKDSSRSQVKKRSKWTLGDKPGGIRVRDLSADPRDKGRNWPAEEEDVVLVSVTIVNCF